MRILQADKAIYEKNRMLLGSFWENLRGKNPHAFANHEMHRGQVFHVTEKGKYDKKGNPKGEFIPNAMLSDDSVDEILRPR